MNQDFDLDEDIDVPELSDDDILDPLEKALIKLIERNNQLQELLIHALGEFVKATRAPKRVVRDSANRVVAVEPIGSE